MQEPTPAPQDALSDSPEALRRLARLGALAAHGGHPPGPQSARTLRPGALPAGTWI